jgi:hypothetical protein
MRRFAAAAIGAAVSVRTDDRVTAGVAAESTLMRIAAKPAARAPFGRRVVLRK